MLLNVKSKSDIKTKKETILNCSYDAKRNLVAVSVFY